MRDNTPDILKKIMQRKRAEIAADLRQVSLTQIQEKASNNAPTRGFYQALKLKIQKQKSAVIAEIKQASPSKGVLRDDFDPVSIAKSYADNGADCLSVLTDRDFFQGDIQHLIDARKAVSLPILRKEFIIDAYQVFTSRAMGADAILLIAACLSSEQMGEFIDIAQSLSMDALVEVHNFDELEKVLPLKLPFIGINNRDLRTFKVSLKTTLDLLNEIDKDTLIITESGISNKQDVELMRNHNVHAYLLGEALMRNPDPGKALKEIFA